MLNEPELEQLEALVDKYGFGDVLDELVRIATERNRLRDADLIRQVARQIK